MSNTRLYKETNKTAVGRLKKTVQPLYGISQLSRHHFEGLKNCFHNECESPGNEGDIWIGELVEGSPQRTGVTERSLWATQAFLSVFED